MKLALPVVIAVASVAVLSAQNPTDPIHWTLAAPATPTTAGGKITVKLTAEIDEGWHLYALTPKEGGPIATQITVPDGQEFSLGGDIEEPVPQTAFDSNFNMPLDLHLEKATFGIPLKASAKTALGERPARVAVSYQTCNDHICLPPRQVTVSAVVTIK